MRVFDIKLCIKITFFFALDFLDFLRPAGAAKGSAAKCAEILVPSGASHPLLGLAEPYLGLAEPFLGLWRSNLNP